ncbi:MAG TPA: substrate-binding domain-containing protein [Chthoniobacteraceae bacterium]|nr:substrate-binding domain-containing protein [Chthoniobacteraceae bacterium]
MKAHLYQRLTRALLEEMASGAWRDGQRFLSVREVIRLWQVSRPTACSSIDALQEHGLLLPSPRRGCFLTRDFQSRAQLLLLRNRMPSVRPPLHFEQKARLLKGVRGGKVALLLETKDASPLEEYTEFPPELGPSPRECAAAFVREGRKYGFRVHFFLYDGSRPGGAWVRERLKEGAFDGAAVFCRSSHLIVQSALEPLMERRLPIVIMYDDCQGLPVHSINLNNVGLGYDAIRHLYQMGHRRITVLMRKGPLKLHKARLKGCLLAQAKGRCTEAQLTVLRIDFEKALTRQVRRHFADPATRPTAVFSCESNAVHRLVPFWTKIGLSVPEDLSVITCSSKARLQGLEVPLDTMQLKMGAKIGRTAARQLHRIQTGEALEKSVLLNVRYVRRGSTRALE